MKKIFLISGYVFVFFFLSCKNPVDNHQELNEDLIQNSSFEVNGNPTINGWTYHSNIPSDTLQEIFSNEVPPSGGNWSLLLVVGDRVMKYLQTKIAAPVGYNLYKLSVWAKSYWSSPRGSPSYIAIYLNDSIRKRVDIKDSTWTYYETCDTILTQVGDTLTIELNSGTAYRVQRTYFDLCRLELLK